MVALSSSIGLRGIAARYHAPVAALLLGLPRNGGLMHNGNDNATYEAMMTIFRFCLFKPTIKPTKLQRKTMKKNMLLQFLHITVI